MSRLRDTGKHSGLPTTDVRGFLSRLKRGNVVKRDRQGRFYLMTVSDSDTAPDAPQTNALPIGLVQACLEEDWLEWRGGDLVLSETGRAHLRRSAARGDAFRQQHQQQTTRETEVQGARQPVVLNEAESPIGWLRRRKDRNGKPLISDHQYAAGERLRADYWFAHLSPRVTSNWSVLAPSQRSRRGAPASSGSLRDDVIAAKERVMRALMAVGPEVAGVLVDICCELKGLEETEKENGWPQRAGKVIFQIALTRLARHYGLINAEGTAKWQSRRMRHWGTDDYRPTLNAWRKDARG